MGDEELEDRLQQAVTAFGEVAGEMKPPEAWERFGPVAHEEFWQSWPEIRAWGEWLYRLIDAERGEKAAPAQGLPEDEIGGSG